MGELEALLGQVSTADTNRFRAETDRMSRELTAHLDTEEEHLIPALSDVPFPPGRPSEGGGERDSDRDSGGEPIGR